jgi:poly(3-hydroxybutyrate) depolymerase
MKKRLNAWLRTVIAMLIAMFCLGSGLTVHAQPAGSAGVQTAVPKSTTTAPYGYYEYLPPDYNHTGAQKFGLMIFLHGAGERGNGEIGTGGELPKLLNGDWPTAYVVSNDPAKKRSYPVIVLSPQCSDPVNPPPAQDDCGWWDTSRLQSFMQYAKTRYNVDPQRIVVTGLSMGGGGTTSLIRALRTEIAAAVPICQTNGGVTGDSQFAPMPLWFAHAINDTTVQWFSTLGFVNSITAETASITTGSDYNDGNGANNLPTGTYRSQTALYRLSTQSHLWENAATSANVEHDVRLRFTLYRDGGHNVWNRVYNDSNIMRWLFAQRLNQAPQTCNLDVNAGGAFNVADARATVAWMLGFRGTALEDLAGLPGMTGAAIDTYLQAQKDAGALDLDGDNQVRANTDGLMLLRVALGLTGTAVTDKAVNITGSRNTWDLIKTEHLIAKCKLTL